MKINSIYCRSFLSRITFVQETKQQNWICLDNHKLEKHFQTTFTCILNPHHILTFFYEITINMWNAQGIFQIFIPFINTAKSNLLKIYMNNPYKIEFVTLVAVSFSYFNYLTINCTFLKLCHVKAYMKKIIYQKHSICSEWIFHKNFKLVLFKVYYFIYN